MAEVAEEEIRTEGPPVQEPAPDQQSTRNPADKLHELLNRHKRYNQARATAGGTAQPGAGGEASAFDSPGTTDWSGVFAKKKAKTVAPDSPEGSEPQAENTPEPAPVGEPETGARMRKSSEAAGKIIARSVDIPLSFGLAGYAVDFDMADLDKARAMFKATDQEMKELSELWAEYLEATGRDIPPGVALVLGISAIYGAKVPGAIGTRKKRKAKAADHDHEEPEEAKFEVVGEDEDPLFDPVESEETELRRELDQINRMVRMQPEYDKGNMPTFTHHTPRAGYCKWSWMILGEEVPVRAPGQFAGNKPSAAFATLKRMYASRDIPWPTRANDNSWDYA